MRTVNRGQQCSKRVHLSLLAGAALTYAFDREDIVWRAVRSCPHSRAWEHLCFGIAAVVLGSSAWLNIRLASQSLRKRSEDEGTASTRADLLQAFGIAALFPVSGAMLLLCGEILRVLLPYPKALPARSAGDPGHGGVVRPVSTRAPLSLIFRQSPRLCAFLSMLVFSITLTDRLAEVLFGATALLSLLIGDRSPSTAQPTNA